MNRSVALSVAVLAKDSPLSLDLTERVVSQRTKFNSGWHEMWNSSSSRIRRKQ